MYGYQPPLPPRRRSCLASCMITLVVLIFLLLGLALAALLFLKPQLSQQAGDTLALQLDTLVDQKIGEQFGQLDGQLPPGSAGTVIILDSEINDYLAANPQEIAPLDSATVQFVPNDVQATVRAYGLSGTAHADVRAENGRLVVYNPRIDGALGMLLDAEQLGTALETSLNQRMDENGLRVSDVTVDTGQMSLSVEN